MVDQRGNIFDKISEWIRGSSASFVLLVTTIIPWFTPLIPAYMTLDHLTRYLNFPDFMGWVGAAIVEALGLASVSISLSFWNHNRNFMQDKKQVPLWIAILSYCFYISIVFVLNVLIDATMTDQSWVIITARGLLTLLSLPGALLIAMSTLHTELLSKIRLTAQVARETRNKRKLSETFIPQQPTPGNLQKHWHWRTLNKEQRARAYTCDTLTELQEKFPGLSERSGYDWLAYMGKK